MCGSSNVSFSDEVLNSPEQSDEEDTKNVRPPQGPTQRVTLTDDLIEKDYQISEKERGGVSKNCKKSKLPLIVAAAVLIIAVLLFFLLK